MVRGGRRRSLVALVGAAALVSSGCAQLFGIDSPNEVPQPGDGSADATMTDVNATDGAPGDSSAGDGGATDSTVSNDSGGSGDSQGPTDSGSNDGPAEGGPPAEAGCPAIVAAMLSAPIVPPAQWAGLDLSNGGQSNGLPGSGSESLTQAGVAQCASYREPTLLAADAAPQLGGYRLSMFGPVDAGPYGAPLLVYSNLATQGVYRVVAQQGFTGTVQFHSRSGGAYGNHAYSVGIGAVSLGPDPVDAGAQLVMRDGVSFPADWNTYKNDAGVNVASPWANELYDGIMATFSPGTPPVQDCYTTSYPGYFGALAVSQIHACIFTGNNAGPSYFAVRPVGLYFVFNSASNQVAQVYTYWYGGVTTCSSLAANVEAMDWATVGFRSIGGLNLGLALSNPRGLTYTEANAVECNGATVPAPDPGFSAMAWGQSGEVVMEYSPDGGLNYKVYAQRGYKGWYILCDGTGANCWTFQIGQPVDDLNAITGTDLGPYATDWSSSSATATTFSNAFCQATDTDCVAAGDCTFTPNDGKGGTYVGFICGSAHDLFGITFTQGTNIPTQMVSVNPRGP
jgi:hypothetical protein